MIDLDKLEQYRENNRIEAKKSLGGLPKSIWETYSAFANTMGGYILLGVIEKPDHSFEAIDLPDPERLIAEFWDIVNDPDKVSVDLLSAHDVTIQKVDGKRIIVIDVPRADRSYRPVYIAGDPLNSYRRNGEGDYKCDRETLNAMQRDAAVRSQDRLLLTEMDLSVINMDSLHDFRQRMRYARPGHVWEELDDESFLQKIGAAEIGEDGKRHPTAAGLLMFGNERDIVRAYSHYQLDYQDRHAPQEERTDRVLSSSGGWSGNIYDFCFRVYDKLQQGITLPFRPDGTDSAAVYAALREALINCLVNADYYGREGIIVIQRPDSVTFSNPGSMRIEKRVALSGGVSDPRNATLKNMFKLIDTGERKESGIPGIFRVWRSQKWPEPVITEESDPDRVTIKMTMSAQNADQAQASPVKRADKGITAWQKDELVRYLTDQPAGSSSELAELLQVKQARVRQLLNALADEGVVEKTGGNRNRTYRLKR